MPQALLFYSICLIWVGLKVTQNEFWKSKMLPSAQM